MFYEVDGWTHPCITAKVLCRFVELQIILMGFHVRVGGLGKWRSRTIDLNHGCNQGCRWKGMVGFEFLHFLSVVMSSLKGSQMTWWFKCNHFHGENQ
jgi:hypothetical protein